MAGRWAPLIRLTAQASKDCLQAGVCRFRPDMLQPPAAKLDAAHTVVHVQTNLKQPLGLGLYSPAAPIPLFLCERWAQPPAAAPPGVPAYLRTALAAAVQRRHRLGLADPEGGARLVQAEGDALPGLVVDRYADCVVIQTSTALMDAYLLDVLVPALRELTAARCVVLRNGDNRLRRKQGLPLEDRVLHGSDPGGMVITEHGVKHLVFPLTGQKTGFYLDQRLTRRAVQARAAGRRVLDVYASQGAVALAALAGGAPEALAVDSSLEAIGHAQEAAELNGFGARLQVAVADAVEALKGLAERRRQFDLIVLDPPSLANSREQLPAATGELRALHRYALRCLAPQGVLVSCSCSPVITADVLKMVLTREATRQGVALRLAEGLGLPPDHPVPLCRHTRELDYLAGLVVERC
eukprot:EG_transcript_12072